MTSCTKHTVLHRSPHNMCLTAETSINEFGIESFMRICITSLGPRKTKIRVLGRVNMSNGKFPLPVAWKNTYQRFQLFYADLFGSYLMSSPTLYERGKSSKSSRSGSHGKPGEGRSSSSKDALLLKRSKTAQDGGSSSLFGFANLSLLPRRQYSDYVIAFLFIMLLLNTLILWNLVVAAERSQNQINDLKAQLSQLLSLS